MSTDTAARNAAWASINSNVWTWDEKEIFNAGYDAALRARPETAAEEFIAAAIDRAPEPLRRLGRFLAEHLDEDHFKRARRMLLGGIALDAECIAGLEGQLKAQAGNAAEEAKQNAAEIRWLKERCAELESERDAARRVSGVALVQMQELLTRAEAAEARLAQVREALRAARPVIIDGAIGRTVQIYFKRPDDAAKYVDAIRVLASDTDTGGEQP